MLRALVIKSKIEVRKKDLEKARQKSDEIKLRVKEIETALGELTENSTDEERNAVEAAANEVDELQQENSSQISSIESEISELETELAKTEKAQRSAAPNNTDKGKENKIMNRTKFYGMSVQERDAFLNDEKVKGFLQKVRTCMSEKRALENVGLVIPEIMLDLVKTKVKETSKLMSRVDLRQVAGKGRTRIMGNIPEAIWTEMCGKINELSLGFSDAEVDGYKVSGFFAVCNAILEDNDVNLATEIINALSKSIGKAVDKAIIYGTGVKMPLGVVTRLAQTKKPENYPATAREWKDLSTTNIITGTDAAGVKLFQEIVRATGVIENDYSETGLIWVMNKKTHTALTVQSMDKNLNAAIVAGINNSMPVIGGDIVELPFIPDNNIVFGYFDSYLLAERAGITLGQSEHVRFLDDQTAFKGTARYDGVPYIAEAFGVLTITSEAPTNTVTFAEDQAND